MRGRGADTGLPEDAELGLLRGWHVGSPDSVDYPPIACGHTVALGNITGQEGHFGAGSCVNSQERALSQGRLLGRDSWQGQRGQCFPSSTLEEVATSSFPLVLTA